MNGLLITVEGGDGAGKSTLAAALAERWRADGRDVETTREPGGTLFGQGLRELLLDAEMAMGSWTETLLFLADRSEHVTRVIGPALERGAVVLCDRYADSTLAYQGYGRGLDLELLRRLNDEATGALTPDATLLLDVSAEAGAARARGRASDRADRFEDDVLAFHRRVNAGFRAIASQSGGRVRVIDAEREFDLVLSDALTALASLFAPVEPLASEQGRA